MVIPIENKELQLAYEFVELTGKNIFLTGKAGTGKTTFLHSIKSRTAKRTIVVAPTGVAAINASGVTIHSFFQIAPGLFIPDLTIRQDNNDDRQKFRMNREKINIIRSLDLLIIDEISMVRADLLDAVDTVLRRYRNNSKPFGGVQLLLIGDLQQLAPVVKESEKELLSQYYDTFYFYGSKALQKTQFVSIELKHIYRQSEQNLIDLLNKVRENRLDEKAIAQLDSLYKPHIDLSQAEGYITLSTHNNQAQQINISQLKRLQSKEHSFSAVVNGDFPESAYPTDYELVLKAGAQVMFVKNDPSAEKLYYNGKIGAIVHIDEDDIIVKCEGDTDPILVTQQMWKNTQYAINEKTKEITEKEVGSFIQYPLKLAWAITIHKSQGLTFDKTIIDAQDAFAHGQVYVALSRCRTIDGIVLTSKISAPSIKSDNSILGFTREIEENQPDQTFLSASKLQFQQEQLFEMFDFSDIVRQLWILKKMITDNGENFETSIVAQVSDLHNMVIEKQQRVGEIFQNEIRQHILKTGHVEKNPILQGRIQKACCYFMPLIETVSSILTSIKYADCDNSNVKQQLGQSVSKIVLMLFVKQKCMETCSDEFTSIVYMRVKAEAAVETKIKPQKQTKSSTEQTSESLNFMLTEQLREWRDIAASQLNLPVHNILPRKAMIEISNSLPANNEALLLIHGFGKAKVEKFGNDITSIVLEFCANNDLKPNYASKSPIDLFSKERKIPSKQTTYEMFNAGKTVVQIAAVRKLTIATIEEHLALYVASGDLSPELFVAPDRLQQITAYFNSSENFSLTKAREYLGEEFSYSDLKFALAFLRR